MSKSQTPADRDSRSPKHSDAFSADPLSGKIGKMLRDSYQEVVEEGIPDDFLDLLRQADASSAPARKTRSAQTRSAKGGA